MTDRSHLYPAPTTDKNGKQTTVYRKPEQSAHQRSPLPAPAVAAPAAAPCAPDESYAERLEEIEEANDMWRRNLHGDIEHTAVSALLRVGPLVRAAALADRRDGTRLSTAVEDATTEGEYSQILIAHALGDVCAGMRRERRAPGAGVPDATRRKGYTASAPDPDAMCLAIVMEVASHLQDADLLGLSSVPEPEDERFAAHLWMHATGALSYDLRGDEITDIIRVIDQFPEQAARIRDLLKADVGADVIRAFAEAAAEFPDRADEIERLSKDGLHAAAIREVIAGGTSALADGAL